jgi:hypothetical protein
MIRGISDLLSGETSEHDKVWQPQAAKHEAAFAVLDRRRLCGSDPEGPK